MKELMIIRYNDESASLVSWMEDKLIDYDIPHLFVHDSMDVETVYILDGYEEEDYCDCCELCCEEDDIDDDDYYEYSIFNVFQDSKMTIDELKKGLDAFLRE